MTPHYNAFAAQQHQLPFVTIGTVVDTNDPMQMGRVRVICPTLGESYDSKLENIPWAVYISPFAGSTSVGTKGPGMQMTEGPVSYGFWSIPKVRAQVAVSFVDNDPNLRVYFGGAFDLTEPHTLPHGRWMMEDHPALEKRTTDKAGVFGPYTSNEKLIQPLADNMRRAFGGNINSPEWATRVADFSASAVDIEALNTSMSKAADDKDVTVGTWINRQGYQTNRQSLRPGDYDNMVYSWTSPGFHSMSMDDREENCRMRFRTTAGHQILLDDTNERVYVMTAEGNNWFEMDQAGNIEFYTSGKFAVRAEGDINFTSDSTVRILGRQGVHIKSDTDVRIESTTDTHVKVGTNLNILVANRMDVKNSSFDMLTSGDIAIKSNGSSFVDAGATLHLIGSTTNVTSRGNLNLNAAGNMYMTAAKVTSNGPQATPATASPAAPMEASPAFLTNRVPTHEPYVRASSVSDMNQTPDVTNAGRKDGNRTFFRGKYWRR